MKTVYVQKRRGEFANVNCFASAAGFRLKGYDVRGFEREDVPNLDLKGEDTIVHGEIGAVKAALRQIAVVPPEQLRLPQQLASFLGREQWETTLGAIRGQVQQELDTLPIFIKPINEQKQFTGHIVRAFRDLLKTAAFDEELPVMAQGVVDFRSEWRVFILEKEILNASCYRGDPLLFPDSRVIREFVSQYDCAPVAYSADFGVTADRTLLVECNDAFALGCYGLSPFAYSNMIEARWTEMCRRR